MVFLYLFDFLIYNWNGNKKQREKLESEWIYCFIGWVWSVGRDWFLFWNWGLKKISVRDVNFASLQAPEHLSFWQKQNQLLKRELHLSDMCSLILSISTIIWLKDLTLQHHLCVSLEEFSQCRQLKEWKNWKMYGRKKLKEYFVKRKNQEGGF